MSSTPHVYIHIYVRYTVIHIIHQHQIRRRNENKIRDGTQKERYHEQTMIFYETLYGSEICKIYYEIKNVYV